MNFDEFGMKLKQFSKDTVAEVQKLNEVRQLNSNIGNERKRIRSTYAEIGRKLYNLYKDEPLTGFESEIQSLKISFRKIDRLQEQIRTVKGVRLCPHCKSEIGASERFCPNCGSKMPEEYTVEEETETVEFVEDAQAAAETAEAVEAETAEGAQEAAETAEAETEEDVPAAAETVEAVEAEEASAAAETAEAAPAAGEPADM